MSVSVSVGLSLIPVCNAGSGPAPAAEAAGAGLSAHEASIPSKSRSALAPRVPAAPGRSRPEVKDTHPLIPLHPPPLSLSRRTALRADRTGRVCSMHPLRKVFLPDREGAQGGAKAERQIDTHSDIAVDAEDPWRFLRCVLICIITTALKPRSATLFRRRRSTAAATIRFSSTVLWISCRCSHG